MARIRSIQRLCLLAGIGFVAVLLATAQTTSSQEHSLQWGFGWPMVNTVVIVVTAIGAVLGGGAMLRSNLAIQIGTIQQLASAVEKLVNRVDTIDNRLVRIETICTFNHEKEHKPYA